MCKKIAEWLLKSVKVSRSDIDAALDKVDTDFDGFFSLGEIVAALIEIVRKR